MSHEAPSSAPALPDTLERSLVIQAPPERVWAALTEPRHLITWFGDAGAEVELRPGGRLEVRWKEHGVALGVVEEVDPGRTFGFRWSLEPGVAPRPGNTTRVTFSLEPLGPDATRLTVVETGFQSLEGTEEERRAHLDGNTSGWRAELAKLVRILAPDAA